MKGRIREVWLGPTGSRWRGWIKQALFASIEEEATDADVVPRTTERPAWLDEDLDWLGLASPDGTAHSGVLRARDAGRPASPVAHRDRGGATDGQAAVIVDLAGDASLKLGLALGYRGFLPILAINATSSYREVIDMAPVREVLALGVKHPGAFPTDPEAPPAFLLDARREGEGRARGGSFDNRWTLYASDLPSAAELRERAIKRVVVVQDGRVTNDDVRALVGAYERGGLDVRLANGASRTLEEMPGPREGWLSFATGQVLRRFVFGRQWDGSYGHRVPIPPAPSRG